MACEQVQRLEGIERRIATIEMDHAVQSERWSTVDHKLDDLGTKLDAHQQASEERGANLVSRLLDERSSQDQDRKQLALKAMGIVGTIIAAMAGAGGVGWLAGGGEAAAVQAAPAHHVEAAP